VSLLKRKNVFEKYHLQKQSCRQQFITG